MKPLFLFSLSLLVGCKQREKPFSAPIAAEVSDILLATNDLPEPNPEGLMRTTIVPKSDYRLILDYLDGAPADNRRMKWVDLGVLMITTTTGAVEISLYSTGKETSAFKVNSQYYIGGDVSALIRLVEGSNQRSGEQEGVDGKPPEAPQPPR